MKFKSILELYDYLPEDERILVDVLRQIVSKHLPENYKEKLSFSVPYFYVKRGICIIWPAYVKGGGVKEGVLLGFIHGNKLHDTDHYLFKGTNKKIFYKIYLSPEQIDESAIAKLLTEAVRVDNL
jgi:hypothetical protein